MDKLEKVQDTVQQTAQRLDSVTANLEATQGYVEGVSSQVAQLLDRVNEVSACQEQIMEQIALLREEIKEGNKAIIQLSMKLSKRVDRLEERMSMAHMPQAVGV